MSWTDWFSLEKRNLLQMGIPDTPGIYEIRVEHEFPRLKGRTRIVNIGGTRKRSLKDRLGDKSGYEAWAGAMKWLHDMHHIQFEVRWYPVESQLVATTSENVRLAQFLEAHWELPPGNGQAHGTDPDSVRRLLTANPTTVEYLGGSG